LKQTVTMRNVQSRRSALPWCGVVIAGLAVVAPAASAQAPTSTDVVVTFVCEHGAAKSVLAATLFNRLATERGARVRAVARGITPSSTLQPDTVDGLDRDGLRVEQVLPERITRDDERLSWRVVSIDVAEEPSFLRTAKLREWDGVPAVSQGYDAARDDLARRVTTLLDEFEASP
jgi:arsenate reductase